MLLALSYIYRSDKKNLDLYKKYILKINGTLKVLHVKEELMYREHHMVY